MVLSPPAAKNSKGVPVQPGFFITEPARTEFPTRVAVATTLRRRPKYIAPSPHGGGAATADRGVALGDPAGGGQGFVESPLAATGEMKRQQVWRPAPQNGNPRPRRGVRTARLTTGTGVRGGARSLTVAARSTCGEGARSLTVAARSACGGPGGGAGRVACQPASRQRGYL